MQGLNADRVSEQHSKGDLSQNEAFVRTGKENVKQKKNSVSYIQHKKGIYKRKHETWWVAWAVEKPFWNNSTERFVSAPTCFLWSRWAFLEASWTVMDVVNYHFFKEVRPFFGDGATTCRVHNTRSAGSQFSSNKLTNGESKNKMLRYISVSSVMELLGSLIA